jgi:type IV secretory pathway VirB4 component
LSSNIVVSKKVNGFSKSSASFLPLKKSPFAPLGMAFDRGLGLNIFANVIDANYTDFSNGIQNINPLQIDAQYKPFLQSWVKGLLGRNDDDDAKIIANALNECFELPKSERTLSNIAIARCKLFAC